MIKVDKRSDRPIYKQIYDGFFNLIESGEIKVGDSIPSERDLCESLDVSRMTLRKALNELVRDGLLIRKQGANTFVSSNRIVKSALGFMSFTQEMQSRNMSAESKVTICEERLAEKKIAKELGIPEGSKVIYLERIRIANNEPMALEKVFLISERFPGLTDYDFETQSLYEILERDFNCYPIVAEEMIESIVLDKNDARLMNISENSPALRVSRITRDDNGNSVEVVETLYRADRYQIFLIRRRQEGKGYS